MTSLVSRALLLLLLLPSPEVMGQTGAPGDSDWGARVKQIALDLADLNERIQALRPDGYNFNMDERVLDAELLFELGQYERSAQLLTSLVDDQRFAQHPSHWRVVRLLGTALYKMGNYLAAYKQFERCVAQGRESDLALGFMIEIAARLGRYDDLESLAARIADTAPPGLLYAKGKALYLAESYTKAANALNRVPTDAPDGRRARYLLGATLVASGQTQDALQVFQALSGYPASVEPMEVEIRELTFMALGRLAYSMGEYSKAVDYYQEVPRESHNFERTLFEVVNTYLQWTRKQASADVRYERLRRAAELLATLRGVAKDPEVLRQSLILSGRISMQLERWDEAKEAFETVVQEFSFASGELSDLVRDKASMERFFDMVVKGAVGTNAGEVFVSQQVVDWLVQQPSLGRVMALLQDLARQKKDLEEAEEIFASIKHVVDVSGGQPMLAGFSNLLFTALELEIRILDLDAAMWASARRMSAGEIGESHEKEAARLAAQRAELMAQLERMPRDVAGYEKRVLERSDRVRELAKETYSQYLILMGQQEQLLALERLLKDAKYRGGALASLEAEKQVRTELDQLAKDIARLIEVAQKLRNDLDAEGTFEDPASAADKRDDSLRERLWKQLDQEALFYDSLRRELSGKPQSQVTDFITLHTELRRMLGQVQSSRTSLGVKSSDLAVSLKQILAKERKELDARARELADAQRVCLVFAKQVGVSLLVQAKEDLVRSVVEADLGLVDILWNQKRVHSDRVEALNRERVEATRWIAAELNLIREEMKRELEEKFLDEGQSEFGEEFKSGDLREPSTEQPAGTPPTAPSPQPPAPEAAPSAPGPSP